MSNADDRCARKDCQASRMAHGMHDHAFVEPPAPSGDEAKVREIARAEAESIASRWVPAHMTARQGMVDDITASLVRYRALGRDDARRGSEGT